MPLVEILRNHLRKSDVVLLLDNCEHLLPSCAEHIEALLRGAPTLRILATSREALGVAGELEYALVPLAVPSASADPEKTVAVPAVRLFLERSSATHGRSHPTAIATVARICELDGIPLVIGRGAPDANARSTIVAHLTIARFSEVRRRAAVPRHQTLEATMDWSYSSCRTGARGRVWRRPRRLHLRAATEVASKVTRRRCSTRRWLVERSLVVADLGEGGSRRRLLDGVAVSERFAAGRPKRAARTRYFRAGSHRGPVCLAVEHDNVSRSSGRCRPTTSGPPSSPAPTAASFA